MASVACGQGGGDAEARHGRAGEGTAPGRGQQGPWRPGRDWGGWQQGTVWSGHLGRGVQAGSLTPSEVSVGPVLDSPSEVAGARRASKA